MFCSPAAADCGISFAHPYAAVLHVIVKGHVDVYWHVALLNIERCNSHIYKCSHGYGFVLVRWTRQAYYMRVPPL